MPYRMGRRLRLRCDPISGTTSAFPILARGLCFSIAVLATAELANALHPAT